MAFYVTIVLFDACEIETVLKQVPVKPQWNQMHHTSAVEKPMTWEKRFLVSCDIDFLFSWSLKHET